MPTNHHSPSQLRHTITIQSEVVGDDEGGGGGLTWSDFATEIPAKIIHVSGREVQFADGQQGQINTIIVIRYLENVTEGMRAVFNNSGYNIRSVIDPEERNEWLELGCERGVPT
jgi:SPP1 family predicted phage head-tail adaptor